MMILSSKYIGCFLGLAMGDAFGAPFEGGLLERLLWQVIGKTRDGKRRYTDDTQMSIDLASSLLECGELDQVHLAATFAASYRWSRGYGPSAGRLLKQIRRGAPWHTVNRSRFTDGSFGNGAAMRAPILALYAPRDESLLTTYVVKSAEITHAHPLAIEGATLVALTTRAALHEQTTSEILSALPGWTVADEFQRRIQHCIDLLHAPNTVSTRQIKQQLGNGIAAQDSCVTAIYFALAYRAQGIDEMLRQIRALGGDVDTISAMAGAIWGAFNGADTLPADKVQRIEDSNKIIALSEKLFRLCGK